MGICLSPVSGTSVVRLLVCISTALASFGGVVHAFSSDQSLLPDQLQEARDLLELSQRADLDGVIEAALLRNPRLLSASQRIEARRSQLSSSERRWLPKALFNTSGDQPLLGQYFETDIARDPKNDLASSHTFDNYGIGSLNLQVSWNFWEPSRQPAINVSSFQLDAEKLTFDVIARSIVLDAQLAYYELQENQHLIDIYEGIYHRNRQLLEIVESQFKGGLVHIGDVSQQKTLLLSQLITLDGLYRVQLQVASDLARIMGLPPGSAVLPIGLGTDRLTTWDLDLNQSIQDGLALREEIHIALADANAQDWEAQRLVNLYLPVMGLSANGYKSYSRGVFDGDVNGNNNSYRATNSYAELTLGLGFNWNFYDGGVRAAQAAASRNLAAAQRHDADGARNRVGNQIRSSYAAYLTAKHALPDSEEAIRTAKLAVDVASQRYGAGIGDITTVVQATQLLGEASTQRKAVRLTYRNAVAELYRYSGLWPKPYRSQIRTLLKLDNP